MEKIDILSSYMGSCVYSFFIGGKTGQLDSLSTRFKWGGLTPFWQITRVNLAKIFKKIKKIKNISKSKKNSISSMGWLAWPAFNPPDWVGWVTQPLPFLQVRRVDPPSPTRFATPAFLLWNLDNLLLNFVHQYLNYM